jgi:shikimate kinase
MADTPTSEGDGAAEAPRIVALAGFMGSGKSSIGEALAELLAWRFVDLDSEIEAHEGVAIRRLFTERGEAAFRAIEHEVLGECLLGCVQPTVIALGGGAFVQPNNVSTLRASHAVTVFLEAPVEVMLQRCGVADAPDPKNERPLAADTSAFRKLYEQRLPAYRQADLTVKTAGKGAIEVAHEIAGKLGIEAKR